MQYLLLYDFPYIDNKDEVQVFLREKLPECAVVFTYGNEGEYKAMVEEDRKREEEERRKQEEEGGSKDNKT